MTAPRLLSHWGWGWADKFPDAAGRVHLGAQVAAVLGTSAPTPEEPVPLDAVTMRNGRVTLPDTLAALGSSTAHDRTTHTYGRAYRDIVRGFYGQFEDAPDLVVRPRTESDVRDVLDWASDHDVVVVPYGGGTSVVQGVEAGAQASRGGVVSLDMGQMNQVLEVDDLSRLARIQAGATGPELERGLARHGLTLRHFPQSFEFSTLGGWVATRAGGHYATLYTHIDDRVASVRMVSPAGLYESRTLPGSGAGPSPDRMVIGSEGILGVITESWVRVVPRPDARAKASVRFDRYEDAVRATRQVAQSGLNPANCRLLDAREAMLFGVSWDMKAILLLGFESACLSQASRLDEALEIARGCGGEVQSRTISESSDDGAAGDHQSWRQAFIDAPYMQNTMVSLGMLADTFETACTWSNFESMHGAIVRATKDAMKSVCGGGLITCRFTHVYPDGPAPYYTFIAPARRGAELEQWAVIKKAASDAILAHGGTITHHHAVGRMHRPWYDAQRPALFADALVAAKKTFDPAGVLNPGVLVGP